MFYLIKCRFSKFLVQLCIKNAFLWARAEILLLCAEKLHFWGPCRNITIQQPGGAEFSCRAIFRVCADIFIFGEIFTSEQQCIGSSISPSAASAHQQHQHLSSISTSAAPVHQQQHCIIESVASAHQQQQCISSNSASAASAHQHQQCISSINPSAATVHQHQLHELEGISARIDQSIQVIPANIH